MILRRLFALVLALLVAGASVSPCTIAAIASAGDAAARQGAHAEHADREHAGHAGRAQTASGAHDSADCHGPSASIEAQCPCGCAGDGPRAAASPVSAPWALPAPLLARIEAGGTPATLGRVPRPAQLAPSRIDHVPIGA